MKILIPTLLGVLALSGCSSEEPQRETPMADDQAIVIDPVNGHDVQTNTPWKSSWKGRWYYFESEGNLKAFEANPSAYVPGETRRDRPERRKLVPSDLH
jgi:YHS domain-containing protein